MSDPLNNYLYRQLVQIFKYVEIASPGESLQGAYGIDVRGRKRFIETVPGEYYRVNCPFCVNKTKRADTRQRLWIHHRWGTGPGNSVDVPAGYEYDEMWWAAVCYNEQCLQDSNNVHALRKDVFKSLGRERRRHIQIDNGNLAEVSLGVAENPGKCIRLDELAPDHKAVQYVTFRGFDAELLGKEYGVAYCYESPPRIPLAFDRLIVPIYMRGTQVSWQGRHIGEMDWRQTPKYYFAPNTNKRLMLYNYDVAKQYPFVIVCEGVTDCWAVGEPAVALFGKTASFSQQELLSKWPTVVLMLDQDAYESAEQVYQQLSQRSKVIRVDLPKGADPASVDKEHMWDLIYSRALHAGVDLCTLARGVTC